LSSDIGVAVVSNPLITTNYELIGTDNLNCKDTTNIVVSVIPLPTATIVSGGGTICTGDSTAIIVDVSGNPDWNLTYLIDGNVNQLTSSTSPVVIYSDQAGTYTIPYVSDDNGCSNIGIGSVNVIVLNTPQASFDYFPKNPNILQPEISFVNNTIYANSYYWQFGDNSANTTEFDPIHYYFEEGTYQVTLVAESTPCTDTAVVSITINPYFALYVPNTFTPNSDGLNDDFEPKGVSIENYEIYIYSRWGDEVFYSDNIDYHWDGGKGVSGSYGYVINVVDKLGEFHQVKGNVLLE
jgi:gliding motility-associated-like protein